MMLTMCLPAPVAFAAAPVQYPVRALRMVVPYTPGSSADLVTRLVAQEISYGLGQTLLLDNRAGDNGIAGVNAVAKANADGYTIGTVTVTHAIHQTRYPRLPYHAINSFETVSLLATAPLIVCASNGLAAKDTQALLALAKARPGSLAFASGGIGATSHLVSELLMSSTGMRMIHKPYKGIAPALQDLLNGRIAIMLGTPDTMLPYVRAGKSRALGLAAEKRAAFAPEIPTLIESGVNVTGGSWVGWLVAAGTPKAIIEQLNAEIMTAVKQPELRERMLGLGVEPVGGSAAEFRKFLRDEVEKWGNVIKQAGVKIEG